MIDNFENYVQKERQRLPLAATWRIDYIYILRQKHKLEVPNPWASIILLPLVPLFLKYFLRGTEFLVSVLLGPLSFLSLGKCPNLKVLPLCKLVGPQIWSPQTHTSKHWNLVTVASYIPSSTLICIILTVSLWADGLLCQHLCIRPSGALSPFSFQPRGTAVSPQLPLSYSVPFQTYITPFHFLQTSVTPQVGEKCKVEDPRVQLVMVNTDITHHVPLTGYTQRVYQRDCYRLNACDPTQYGET